MQNQVLVMLALSCSLWSETLTLKNRPFEGKVTQENGRLHAEVGALCKGLGLNCSGSEEEGFVIGSGAPAGPATLYYAGKTIAISADGLVDVESLAQLLGVTLTRDIVHERVDLRLATAPASTGAAKTGLDAPYNLILWLVPSTQICKDMEPTFGAVRKEFPSLNVVIVDVGRNPKLHHQYKPNPANTYCEASLVDGSGKILFQLRGNHVITNTLLPELRKAVR